MNSLASRDDLFVLNEYKVLGIDFCSNEVELCN